MYKMYEKEKKHIIDICNKMIEKDITRETGGNVSVYIRDDNVMLITPSGIPYDIMKVEDIVEMKLDGTVLRIKDGLKPSTEWKMHAEGYKVKPSCNAFIHAHAIHSMVISTLYKSLPAIDYLIAFSGNYEVPVTEYARFGTSKLAEESSKYLSKYYAVILANHGINVCAETLNRTFGILENLELCAELYCKAKTLGEPKIIDKDEMLKLTKIFLKAGYGAK